MVFCHWAHSDKCFSTSYPWIYPAFTVGKQIGGLILSYPSLPRKPSNAPLMFLFQEQAITKVAESWTEDPPTSIIMSSHWVSTLLCVVIIPLWLCGSTNEWPFVYYTFCLFISLRVNMAIKNRSALRNVTADNNESHRIHTWPLASSTEVTLQLFSNKTNKKKKKRERGSFSLFSTHGRKEKTYAWRDVCAFARVRSRVCHEQYSTMNMY